MTKQKMKQIMRELFQLNRPVTDEELEAEIKSLERRRDKGALDDFETYLAASLKLI